MYAIAQQHQAAARTQRASSTPRRRMGVALATVVSTAAAAIAAPSVLHAQGESTAMAAQVTSPPAPVRDGYVESNGVRYYYQVHGQGEPLLLLHGGLGSIEMFGPVLQMLAARRQVIGVDLHGHGRTALGDREVSLVHQGDDMAALLRSLGHDKVDVMGYSLGAGVAFQLGVQHPQMVRRLVLVSAGYSRDGFYPEMLPQQASVNGSMAEMMRETPMYQSYAAIAPHPEDFPRLLDRMGEYMRKAYDWEADVAKLTMPVMLVYGDSDMFRPEHIIRFYQLLGGGQRDAGWMREHMSPNRLAILPDLTHYEIFSAPALATTVLPFLDDASGPASWAEQVSQGQ
ncbi:MAG TPA: alpha/beta hydrolase [Longimicrobium sp.]|nr:alpha/beta hydrolase [Longimicrobium sp.]